MHLFRFHFEATVGGVPFLSMTKGCAGFFTAEELAAGQGIVLTSMDKRPIEGKRVGWRALVEMGVESYSDEQIEALRAGDLATCFGEEFAGLPVQRPSTLPGRDGRAHAAGTSSFEARSRRRSVWLGANYRRGGHSAGRLVFDLPFRG